MASVDAPPGIDFAGRAAGEFAARPRARRLARMSLFYVGVVGMLTAAIALRRMHTPFTGAVFVVTPMMCFAVAFLGFAVRSARISVDADGVRWGWRWGGFRMRRDRMRKVASYSDAFALTPRRGSTWYLSSRDWDRFERVPMAMRRARIPYTRHDRRAPFLARLQSYGIVLDFLLVANALAVTFALVAAITL